MKKGWSTSMDDGYIRTFQLDRVPKLNKAEKKTLAEWREQGKLEEISLYFTEALDVDEDIAGFMLREFLRGNL